MKIRQMLIAGAMALGLSGASFASTLTVADLDTSGSTGFGDGQFDQNDIFKWEEITPFPHDSVTIEFLSTVERAIAVVQVEFLGDLTTVQDLTLSFNGGTPIVATDGTGNTSFPGGVIKFFVDLVGGNNTIVATGSSVNNGSFDIKIAAVPIPAAGVLFGTVFMVGAAFARRRRVQKEYGLPSDM